MPADVGGSGGGGETPEERNKRLQAAFDAAQAAKEDEGPAPYYPPTSYTDPNVPDVTSPTVPSALTQSLQDLAWTQQEEFGFGSTPQGSYWGDYYSQGGIPQDASQAIQQDYWGNFYSQGTSQAPPAPTNWTEQELDMLGGMDVQQAINWGANYTGQALFGGWNVITNEPFMGAFDMTTGELVNPELMPSLLSPEFSTALGISEEQRVMLGYNPEYPYNLQQPTSAGGGGGGGWGGYSGGGYSPSKGYGYGGGIGLTNWRIG